MTSYHWADLYQQAVTNFGGERPGAQIEQQILETFERNPQAVKDAIAQVSKQYTNGKITSGWAVLAKHLATHTGPTADRTATDKSQRAKRITQAETWIKNAGIHYDAESEVEDELFGDRGMLRDWHQTEGLDNRPQDTALHARFLDTWRQARPIGQQLEADLEQRSQHWKQTTGILLTDRNRRRLAQQADPSTNHELTTQSITTDVDLPAEPQPQETT